MSLLAGSIGVLVFREFFVVVVNCLCGVVCRCWPFLVRATMLNTLLSSAVVVAAIDCLDAVQLAFGRRRCVTRVILSDAICR